MQLIYIKNYIMNYKTQVLTEIIFKEPHRDIYFIRLRNYFNEINFGFGFLDLGII